MIDADSPNPERSHLKETEHFLVINIPDSNLAAGDVLAGPIIKLELSPQAKLFIGF